MKISYNWLKWYIPDAPEAEKLAEVFTYHMCEVDSIEKLSDGDCVFDLKVLPDRAHDLLSHMGIAREVASLLNIPYVDPTSKYKIPEAKAASLKIEIQSDPAKDGVSKCRRYIGRIVRGVKVGPSPEWVVKHLESIGQRSINNMVDAANLVMYNSGQPTHVFDMDKVQEKIVVRLAEEGEQLITLDNRDLKLKSSDLVIADAGGAIGIAGVKGGKSTEVDINTKNIIIEVANFDPVSVRKTAQSLGIFTDARKRFENDLSPELASYGMRELSALILEICPEAEFEDIVDYYPKKQEEKKLKFQLSRISSILGRKVGKDEVENILKNYGIDYIIHDDEFEIVVPPLRLDLNIEEDMAEEIGRIMGYDKVEPALPKIDFKPSENRTYAKIAQARAKLLGSGYSEVMTYVFRDKGKVSVLASASDKKFLRSNLSDGLGESLKLNKVNAPLLGLNEVKIFEIGTVWTPEEEIHVAYSDKNNIVEKTLDEFCKDISSDFKLEPSAYSLKPPFKMWSLFPFIARDVAVWVPKEVGSNQVYKVIKENAGELLVRGPDLFDEFEKEGKKSYAFRLVFQSYDRTLTDAEVGEIMDKITAKIKLNPAWQVR